MTADPARIARSPAAAHTLPTTDPLSPSQSPTATRGDAYAFATGAISETMPNAPATTGVVASWATRVSASTLPTADAGPRSPCASQLEASPPKTSSAPTASTESWSPMSKTDHGSMATTTTTAAAREAVASPRRLPSVASPPTTSITRERSAEYGIPVVTAYAAPAAITVPTSAVLGSRTARPSAATAPQARARCEPDTATRCVSPRTRKSSSTGVPTSLRRSPSTMPSMRSPPSPDTPCILWSTPSRHANSVPTIPSRQGPVPARHAVPVAHAPPRATPRAHASSAGSVRMMAENRTIRPSSGTSCSAGHPTRTRAPSSGPPVTRTRTTAPNAPSAGSASTTPVHSRAPQSAASAD